MHKYSDYIIVGGGASGCALTHKLLESKRSVTLIEAGIGSDITVSFRKFMEYY